MGKGLKSAAQDIHHRVARAAGGDGEACYDLGVCYQTGTAGVAIDLIEAHKWFNIAASRGVGPAPGARAEVAEDMSAREIAAAQAAARAWLGLTRLRAA